MNKNKQSESDTVDKFTRVAQLRRLCFELRQRLAASQSTQAHLAEALVQTVSA
jgi:type I restriction enzyme S subunit